MVQFTDSRFPAEDLLIVNPNGFHFGIDIKAQRAKNFWRMWEPKVSDQFFIYLPTLTSKMVIQIYMFYQAMICIDYGMSIEIE